MKSWGRRSLVFGSLFAVIGSARAQPGEAASASSPAVSGAWSRPALQGRAGVVYMTITGGSQDDALVGVQTGLASRADLHRSFNDSGVMRMRPVERIAIPAGAVVRLGPDGYHAMLTGLRETLSAGKSFSFVAQFERAGPVQAEATVRPRGDPPGGVGHGMGDGMPMPSPDGR